ncbi:leucine-rich repeat and IQ domain-containing protein 3 isoform X2 [Hemicordylus capensis]|uniref:leucine-rich repeat and IQ domain-containing protein 3 isoform X2 n=1 Tax=Hemicordylus capensis TaxID=884348 RepID=UPI0023042B84|nr:leucine-rich repeat and IQ domain-containing protein 3 isoform X2 [Hemicordylus capensis]
MVEEFAEYLLSASESLLLEYGQTDNPNDVKKLQDLVMIEDLPGPIFWKNMKYLNLLYLHDNGISTLANVHSLSFCPNLIALTLLNTPLSLKIAYRHIVVNSIFSLKALDYYVISDEEIMENWRLPEKYKPFTPVFFVDFSPLPEKDSTFQEEMKMVKEIISKINHILAHYSPVVIIQKWIRGYLIRKILCLIPVREVLRHKRYIRENIKRIHIPLTHSAYDSKSSMYHIIKPEQHTEVGKLTSGIQVIDVKDVKDLHLYLRRLKLPLLSSVVRPEEKKKMMQMESKKSPRKDLLDWKKMETKEEDELITKFRLSGYRMPFYSVFDELQKYTEKEKDFFDAVHGLRYFMRPFPQPMPIHDTGCIEKRTFARAFGTIRLRPLCAIDKAYLESQSWDIQLQKEREAMRMLISKNEGKDYIDHLHDEKIDTIQRTFEEEKMTLHDIMKENKQNRKILDSKMRQRYARFLESKDAKAMERTFIQGFSTQHTSLARGLLSLDGWRRGEEIRARKRGMIKANLEEQKQRKEVLKHVQEQRLQMLQKRNYYEKMFRKYVTNEMTNKRFQQSKARVEAAKNPREKLLHTLPVIGSSGTAKPVEEYEG